MILQTFVAANSTIIASRAINAKVKEDMKQKILSDGLYHVTTEDAAKKIIESGYIKPSSIIASYGRKKCFFFAGTPNYKDLISNVQTQNQFEFKAIKLLPNNEELSKFRQRIYNDDAITYRGKCELPDDRAQIVDLVLDIDEKGNVYTREKTQEEIENGYIPNEKLSEYIKKENALVSFAKSYANEYKSVGSKIKRNFKELMDKIGGRSQPRLPDKTIPTIDTTSTFENDLKNNTYTLEENAHDVVQDKNTISRDKETINREEI